jgi:hypothetical protein
MRQQPVTVTVLLVKEIEAALRGDKKALWDRLLRGSRLPGPQPNMELVKEFANAMEGQGPKALPLATMMATIHPDEARGGTEMEFIPMCGVMALGMLAAKMDDRAREKPFATIHDAAEDLRFRVRDTVPLALAYIGARHPEWTLRNVAPWMDGFFHAAAVLRAISEPEFLRVVKEPQELVARLEDAFALAENAPRAAARYPGFKALLDAIVSGVPPIATRFPAPAIDALLRFAERTKDPDLRQVIERSARACKNVGAERVLESIARSAPPRRDPRTDVGPTRRRGKR